MMEYLLLHVGEEWTDESTKDRSILRMDAAAKTRALGVRADSC